LKNNGWATYCDLDGWAVSQVDKNHWGKKWEEWQDFFWKHRQDNENADKGFNAFLKWIQLIEIIKNDINEFNNLIGKEELGY